MLRWQSAENPAYIEEVPSKVENKISKGPGTKSKLSVVEPGWHVQWKGSMGVTEEQ